MALRTPIPFSTLELEYRDLRPPPLPDDLARDCGTLQVRSADLDLVSIGHQQHIRKFDLLSWVTLDFFEGDKINERALRNLVRAAVDYNQIKLKKKAPAGTLAKVPKIKKT